MNRSILPVVGLLAMSLFVFVCGCGDSGDPPTSPPEPSGPPTVTVNDQAVVEGTPANFRISLSRASNSIVTLQYATEDSTATALSDYLAVSLTTDTIVPGSTGVSVSVVTIDDGIYEETKSFKLLLTNVTGATFADSVGFGTIIDNDDLTSYANDVKPILLGSCAIPTCHGGTTGRNGLAMGTAEYSTIINASGNYSSVISPNGKVVVPGDADQSMLYTKTLETTDPLFPIGSRMPFGGNALSEGQKTRIRDWINQGAADN